MKTRTSAVAAIVAASCLAFAVPAVATPPSESHLQAVRTLGQITYLSGGVGQTEADAIKHVAKYYPLELEFLRRAKPKDEYLSDVKVRIKDADGKMVLNVTSDGPFLLAKMPAGKYTVSAEHKGRIENREVQIAAKEHRRVVFEWQS
jgi:hypothetical protein